ncbi:MAG TPA: hypothetical protein VD884_23385 [Ohtaekwangia sp.]|nr:hypothetical protein [Ohtaekwangia sp.]
MKKIIYILLIAFSTSLALTSCTEEEVKPKPQLTNPAGGASTPGQL